MPTEPTIAGIRQSPAPDGKDILPYVQVLKWYTCKQEQGNKGIKYTHQLDISDGHETVKAYVNTYDNVRVQPNTTISLGLVRIKRTAKGEYLSAWLNNNQRQPQQQAPYGPPQQQAQTPYGPAQQARDEIDQHFQYTPVPQQGPPPQTAPSAEQMRQQIRQPDEYQRPKTPAETAQICRQNALTAAAKLYASGQGTWNEQEVLGTAALFSHWTISGEMPAREPGENG